MGAADLIEQTPEGCSSPACAARRSFETTISMSRSSFMKNTALITRAITSATSHFVPEFEEGRFLILAGRRWQILDIDHERKSITVRPSPGGRVPGFHGDQGVDIHPRVREVMKALLTRAGFAGLPRHESARDAAPSSVDRSRFGLAHKRLPSGWSRRDLVHLDWLSYPANAFRLSESSSADSR